VPTNAHGIGVEVDVNRVEDLCVRRESLKA